MSKVKIISDSTCDLSAELLAQFEEYCAMNGIALPKERGLADGDAESGR